MKPAGNIEKKSSLLYFEVPLKPQRFHPAVPEQKPKLLINLNTACTDILLCGFEIEPLPDNPTIRAFASAQSDQSSVCAKRVAKGHSFIHMNS